MPTFQCSGRRRGVCDYESNIKWLGRCPQCHRPYDILVKALRSDGPSKTSLANLTERVHKVYVKTGMPEFDKVIGGGIVGDAPYIISGPPGTGKSTLMLTVASLYATEKRPVLYTSGEQSRNDIADIAKRIGATSEHVEVMGNEGDVYKICERAEEMDAKLVFLDSINTAAVDSCDSAEGTSAQLKAVANFITAWCKDKKIALVAIGHVGRDGELGGPMAVAHLFDTILELDPAIEVDEDGDIHQDTAGRIKLTSGKNRHGESNISEYFKMTAEGIVSIKKKSRLELV